MRGCVGFGRMSAWMGLIAFGLTACSGLLPERHEVTISPFTSFETAYAAYQQVETGKTRADELVQMGFNVLETPNIELLTYLDVAELFLPQDSIPIGYLPDAVKQCIELETRCSGYRVAPREIHEERTGNAFLDFLNFRRKTKTTGWEVAATFVIIDDTVVYKLWSGTPHVEATEVKINPLGPIQDVGTILNRAIPNFD